MPAGPGQILGSQIEPISNSPYIANVGSDGRLWVDADLTVSDIQIGAVEIKDGESDQRAVVNTNGELHVNPFGEFPVNIALGLVSGTEIRGVFGTSDIGDGIVNEQAIGDGMTTRYPFPSTAAQMTLVSDSALDDSGSTGAELILVRGNITGNVELFELILLDGLTPVTTVNSYLRINSIVVASVGSGGKNVGTITIKNGTDLLAQINPENNISRMAVYSIPSSVSAIIKKFELLSGKDDSGVINVHLFPGDLGNIDLTAFSQRTYQNIVPLGISSFLIEGGSDIEITGYSQSGGLSNLSSLFELILVDDA